MARIVSLGSCLQDIYLIDHDDLRPTEIGAEAVFGKVLVGSKVDIDKIFYGIGGGGVNSAITFSRHGHEAIFFGNLAHDPAGSMIIKTLDQECVDNSYVNFISRKSTGTSVILLDSASGERTILTHRGTSEQFGNIPETDLDLVQPDWLYITSLRGDLDTVERFIKKAKSIGARVMLNPGIKELEQSERLLRILPDLDALILNKSEAAKIVPGTTLTELLYHLENYTPIVIITDGAMGGIAASSGEKYRFGLYEDVRVKDSTGAGDAFGSGFLAHFAAGKSFRNSLVFAAANSTAVVAKYGANTGALSGTESLHPMPIQKI